MRPKDRCKSRFAWILEICMLFVSIRLLQLQFIGGKSGLSGAMVCIKCFTWLYAMGFSRLAALRGCTLRTDFVLA